MHRWSARWHSWAIYLAVPAVAGAVAYSGWLVQFDRAAYDWMIRGLGRTPAEDIVLVAIDQASLSEIGRWPWPRRVHAALLDRLTEAGARVVALNLILADPDALDPAGDAMLAEAIERHGRVVLPVAFAQTEAGGQVIEILPLPDLAIAAAALGHVDVEVHPDGVVRSVFLTAGLGRPHWPHLGLAVLQQATPSPDEGLPAVSTPGDRDPSPYRWVRRQRVLIPFAGPPGSLRYVSYVDVANGDVPPEVFRDRVVFVGTTAPGLGADLLTPQPRPMPGVEFNANVLDALQRELAVQEVGRNWHILGSVAISAIVFLISQTLPVRAMFPLVGGGMLATLGLSFLLLIGLRVWFPPSPALLAIALSYPLWSWRRLRSREVQIRGQLAELDAVYGTAPVGLGFVGADLRFRRVNERMAAINGLAAGEHPGRSIGEVVPDMADQIEPIYRRVLETGEPVLGVEVRGTTAAEPGVLHDWLVGYHPVKTLDGTVLGVNTVVLDVTERRAAEEQLRQAQKIEALGQLTGGIAHDFNNLLTVIMMDLEMIGELAAEDPQLRELANEAHGVAQSGADLIQRLLAFARRQRLEPRITDVNDLVLGTVNLLRRTLRRTIDIRTDLEADLWYARIDPVALQNALLNLAVNARDAMPDGGVLRFQTQNDRSGPDGRPGDFVVISTSDTGVGITPDVLEHVFEPFFTTKAVGKGTGLGLSMVHGFATQSGGNVGVRSSPGRGTTVALHLPRDAGAPTPPVAEPQRAEEVDRPATILVVEDQRELRERAAQALSELGYRVATAANAEEAMRQLEDLERVDLLFSDIVMPGGMNGRELAERALRQHPGLKILLTSGYVGQLKEPGTGTAAMEVLLPKPYRIDDLARRVREALA